MDRTATARGLALMAVALVTAGCNGAGGSFVRGPLPCCDTAKGPPPPPDPFLADVSLGRVVTPFSVDSGGLTVAPARGNPQVSKARALAIATSDDPDLQATKTGGSSVRESANTVVAYGLVTVSVRARVDSYRRRPAWLVAVRFYDRVTCPSTPPGLASNPPFIEVGSAYTVFVLDATTGRDVLRYDLPSVDACSGMPIPRQVKAARATRGGRTDNGPPLLETDPPR